MAMDKVVLKTAIFNHLKTFWAEGEPAVNPDDDNYWLKQLSEAIAYEVVDHIVANAKCSGADSGADTHDAVGII